MKWTDLQQTIMDDLMDKLNHGESINIRLIKGRRVGATLLLLKFGELCARMGMTVGYYAPRTDMARSAKRHLEKIPETMFFDTAGPHSGRVKDVDLVLMDEAGMFNPKWVSPSCKRVVMASSLPDRKGMDAFWDRVMEGADYGYWMPTCTVTVDAMDACFENALESHHIKQVAGQNLDPKQIVALMYGMGRESIERDILCVFDDFVEESS